MATADAKLKATLIPQADGAAILLDAALLRELGVTDTTRGLTVIVNGRQLDVAPLSTDERRARFEAAKKDTFERYDDVFRRLAE
jgi:hypothetical protein